MFTVSRSAILPGPAGCEPGSGTVGVVGEPPQALKISAKITTNARRDNDTVIKHPLLLSLERDVLRRPALTFLPSIYKQYKKSQESRAETVHNPLPCCRMRLMTTIISWNVNGIRAVHKKGLFLPFIEEHKPDILLLQETKAEQHQSEVDLPDYEEYWHSAEKKGYSGTAIFTKETPITVRNGLPEAIAKKYGLNTDGYGNPNKEGRVIAAEYEDFFVISVYTPNAKDDLSRVKLRHEHWDPAFLAYIKQLEKEKPVIFGSMLPTLRRIWPILSKMRAKRALP
jgi:hypothetical protein